MLEKIGQVMGFIIVFVLIVFMCIFAVKLLEWAATVNI